MSTDPSIPIPIPDAAIEAAERAYSEGFPLTSKLVAITQEERMAIRRILRAAAPHMLGELVEAARLRRNVVSPFTATFEGDWIAIPREDFDRLREALKALEGK